ncbi:MAG: hypothetical protein ACI4EB_02985, partial [Bilifractor sp.]
MKALKISGILAAGISTAMLLAGCSFSGGMNRLVGTVTDTGKETVVSASSEEGTPVQALSFNTDVAAPAFK